MVTERGKPRRSLRRRVAQTEVRRRRLCRSSTRRVTIKPVS